MLRCFLKVANISIHTLTRRATASVNSGVENSEFQFTLSRGERLVETFKHHPHLDFNSHSHEESDQNSLCNRLFVA